MHPDVDAGFLLCTTLLSLALLDEFSLKVSIDSRLRLGKLEGERSAIDSAKRAERAEALA